MEGKEREYVFCKLQQQLYLDLDKSTGSQRGPHLTRAPSQLFEAPLSRLETLTLSLFVWKAPKLLSLIFMCKGKVGLIVILRVQCTKLNIPRTALLTVPFSSWMKDLSGVICCNIV